MSILLDHLVRQGLLSQDLREVILREHSLSKRPIEQLLKDTDLVCEDQWLQTLAKIRGTSLVALDQFPEWKTLAPLFPQDILEKCLAIPFEKKPPYLHIAMADISDIQAYDALGQHAPAGLKLQCFMAKKSDILVRLQEIAPKADIYFMDHYTIDDQVVHQFIYRIFNQAVQDRVSDLHFEPEKFFITLRSRCDGLLKVVQRFHISLWQSLCVQLKILAGMDISQTRLPQDGRFSFPICGRPIDFRISSYPTFYGENLVLRILDKEKAVLDLEQLGYSPGNHDRLKALLKKPEGLIVMTGPTGSGKTTTLYSMLKGLNQEHVNIMTLEEPVEYHIRGLRQSEVRDHSAFTFTHAMTSLLRQDPDVILIGEIRDEETADMAIRAGMTGHLVLTTLHTTNALSTISRLFELKVPLSLVTSVLKGVVAQRLVRTLCSCKKPVVQPCPDKASPFIQEIWPPHIYQAQGCPLCQFQGYKGRQAISEILLITSSLEDLLLSQAPFQDLRAHLLSQGFWCLITDALYAVCSGTTSLEEVVRVLGI